jgi:hypothetical protein
MLSLNFRKMKKKYNIKIYSTPLDNLNPNSSRVKKNLHHFVFFKKKFKIPPHVWM